MLGKKTKFFLVLYAFLLVATFFILSNIFELYLLIAIGIISFTISILVIGDIRKLKGSLASRILTMLFFNLILYLTIILCLGLGATEAFEGWFFMPFTFFGCFVLSLFSILRGAVSIYFNRNKVDEQVIEIKPNKFLSVVLAIILALLLYGVLISETAKLLKSPSICSLNIEVKEDSFIFFKGMRDSCVIAVSLSASNVGFCKQAKRPDDCVRNFVGYIGDADICYQQYQGGYLLENCLNTAGYRVAIGSSCGDNDACYLNLAQNSGNPAICHSIKSDKAQYDCIYKVAVGKNNIAICRSYFPSDTYLIEKGIDIAEYSRSRCLEEISGGKK